MAHNYISDAMNNLDRSQGDMTDNVYKHDLQMVALVSALIGIAEELVTLNENVKFIRMTMEEANDRTVSKDHFPF